MSQKLIPDKEENPLVILNVSPGYADNVIMNLDDALDVIKGISKARATIKTSYSSDLKKPEPIDFEIKIRVINEHEMKKLMLKDDLKNGGATS